MLAIIGGTGLAQLQGLVITDKFTVATPFGAPSSAILKGRIGAQEILFLSRHGDGPHQLPHEINYRANIFKGVFVRNFLPWTF